MAERGAKLVALDLSGSAVLVTGGTGSLANALVPYLLARGVPSIRLYSRGEHAQNDMKRRFKAHLNRLRFIIGDVRDIDKLRRAMNGCKTVIHTAALKDIVTCAHNPDECKRTNIDGSDNVREASIQEGVRYVVGISSDKVGEAQTVYGASKGFMEQEFTVASNTCGGRTLFSCTRNGNVIGSRGSILPLLKEQRKNGEVTLTDDRMTRFWLPIAWAAESVLFALDNMRGGEVFIRKAPSARMMDLIEAVAPGCVIKRIGIREQEKLHEVLVTNDESPRTRDAGDYYVIEPSASNRAWGREPMDHWPIMAARRYDSVSNDWKVTRQQFIADAEAAV